MANVKVIVFDLGDTLMSHLGSKSALFRWFCEEAAVPLPVDEGAVLEAARAGWREGMKRTNPLDWKDLSWREHVFRTGLSQLGVEANQERYIETMMRIKLPKPNNTVEPEVFELLRELRSQGYKLAIISNYYGNLADVLEQTKLAPLFDAALDSDVVGIAKPDSRLFGMVCEVLGTEPWESVYVGDMPPYDVDGAVSAGYHPILLDPCGIWREQGDYTHIRNIGTLQELPEALRMIGNEVKAYAVDQVG